MFPIKKKLNYSEWYKIYKSIKINDTDKYCNTDTTNYDLGYDIDKVSEYD